MAITLCTASILVSLLVNRKKGEKKKKKEEEEEEKVVQTRKKLKTFSAIFWFQQEYWVL